MIQETKTVSATPSQGALPGLPVARPSRGDQACGGKATDVFQRRPASDVIAVGAAAGLSVGTVLSFGLVLLTAGASSPWAVAGLAGVVLAVSGLGGALLGGAAAAMNALAAGVITRLRA